MFIPDVDPCVKTFICLRQVNSQSYSPLTRKPVCDVASPSKTMNSTTGKGLIMDDEAEGQDVHVLPAWQTPKTSDFTWPLNFGILLQGLGSFGDLDRYPFPHHSFYHHRPGMIMGLLAKLHSAPHFQCPSFPGFISVAETTPSGNSFPLALTSVRPGRLLYCRVSGYCYISIHLSSVSTPIKLLPVNKNNPKASSPTGHVYDLTIEVMKKGPENKMDRGDEFEA
ncbi:hypothetical protein BDD12DRAFT_881871 [Trichophaea hybrida]|nr:hypothetical protein BDD12DRAFT_881871 [Trichophaea hybrida]